MAGCPASPRQLANERLVSEIRVLHAESFGCYGSPRFHACLKRQDRPIGGERIRRLMRESQDALISMMSAFDQS